MVTTVCSQLAQYMPFTFRTTRWEPAVGAAEAAADCGVPAGDDAGALAAGLSDAADSPRVDVHASGAVAIKSVATTADGLANAEKRTKRLARVTSNNKTPAR